MCIFSAPVASVSTTRIFARADEDDRQWLAYAMNVAAARDLAMILPVPVPQSSAEDVVAFVDLSAYPQLFEALDNGFPRPEPSRGPPTLDLQSAPRTQPLRVHAVGSFEASFVPTRADFDRLDPRFRLPDGAWGALGAYHDWGFVVFKLRGLGGGAPRTFHPMAFAFPRRDRSTIFLPTMHVHDGDVHPTARFDHALYVQTPARADRAPSADWTLSFDVASRYVDPYLTEGLVRSDRSVLRRFFVGEHANRDVVIDARTLHAR